MFFNALLRPDVCLGVGSASHSRQTARIGVFKGVMLMIVRVAVDFKAAYALVLVDVRSENRF